MKLTNRRIIGGIIALLFMVSIVQTHAIIELGKSLKSENNQSAQVPGANVSLGRNQRVWGPENNGQSFSLPSNTTASIKVCGGGGGGGGGHQVLFNYAGAGGGGGGMGQCIDTKLKFRAKDVLTWNIGQGGMGGNGGIDFQNPAVLDQSPANGQTGGQTQLLVNGSVVATAVGGNGGGHAYPYVGVMTVGGLGGSLTTPQAFWHLGKNGLIPPYGTNGGAGGKGETNTLYGGGVGGAGGTVATGDAFGQSGATGYATFGGGGGGGAYLQYQMDTNYPPYYYVNKGGNGGPGGGGQIILNY